MERFKGDRFKTSWELEKEKEKQFEEKVRELMNRRRITYQEAEHLLKSGQKALFEFK
ncbi:MAG: hypothetical protein KJ574_03190 [Nanoarchaeota archaeon]|nr:hypothetical protein [Nanoarchaeota archaeon]